SGPWVGNTSIGNNDTTGSIMLSFQGTAISFTGNTPSPPSPTWFLARIDSNTPYTSAKTIYMQWYQTPTLSDGIHNINLSSIIVNFDYAIITPGATTPLSGSTIIVDDRNSEITYNRNGWVTNDAELDFGGGWISGLPLGNTSHQTSNVADGFEFQFAGNNITVYGFFSWTAMGSISIDFTLDGKTTSSNLLVPAGTSSAQTFFSAENIEVSNHTFLMNITQANGNQSFIFDFLTYVPLFSSLASKPNF
ncbi:hypothetical protein BT96DRAFT_802821, partial [Gymnopus androsaceus JB14]